MGLLPETACGGGFRRQAVALDGALFRRATATVTERWLARVAGTDVRWEDVYSRLGIDAILTSVMDSRTLPALQTAVNCGKAVLWVANSWKDVYIRSHLPVVPAAAVVCGPKEREILMRGNPSFDFNRIHVGGSLHLTPIKDPSRIMPRDAFCKQSGLDPDRPYICYTSASPAAVRNEEQIVTALADCIRSREFPRDPQLLVRLNPMENGQRFRHLADRPDVVLQRPAWDWCPGRGLEFASRARFGLLDFDGLPRRAQCLDRVHGDPGVCRLESSGNQCLL